MSKSINEYYAEKMKRLLEEQKKDAASPRGYIPAKNSSPTRNETGGKIYDPAGNLAGTLREKTARRNVNEKPEPRRTVENVPKKKTEVIYVRPTVTVSPDKKDNAGVTPEQTVRDAELEKKHKEFALEKARRAKKFRKLRDAMMSVILVLSLFIIMLIIVYKFTFVITDIKVEGNSLYTDEAIINATGVLEGENLYSFRSTTAKARISMRCPLISFVEIDRKAPNTVVIKVEEEKALFYADLYGEFRAISERGRVLYSITEKEAEKAGLIRLYLPTVKNALSGTRIEFAGETPDKYIYEALETVLASPLGDKTVSIDLSNRYRIKMNISSKYLLSVGSIENFETKLKIADKVLQDEVFADGEKAVIDVSDPSETSVVFDHTIELK